MRYLIIIFVFIYGTVSYAQFKDNTIFKPGIKEGIVTESPNLIFGFINPNNFHMSHSYSLSYSSFAGNGLALGVYTNSMLYQFSDDFNLQLDASIVHSPYSSFGSKLQEDITGVYLNRVQLNYKPWDNFRISVQYRNLPVNYYSPYFGIYRGSFIEKIDNDDLFLGR